MNKLYLLLAFLIFTMDMNSQVWVSLGIGGTSAGSRTTISSDDEDDDVSLGIRANYIYVAPTIGYDMSDNLTIGASIAYSRIGDLSLTFDEDEFSYTGVQTISLLPFVRMVNWVSKDFQVYGQLDLALGILTDLDVAEDSEGERIENNLSSQVYGANIRPGILYMFNDNFSMNANFGSLGYNAIRSKVEEGEGDDKFSVVNRTYTLGLAVDMSTLRFGLNYHF